MLNARHIRGVFISVVVICMLLATGAFAENGGFAFVASSVEDGAENVSRQPVIELTFNKNVVNMKVAEHNATCFMLVDGENAELEEGAEIEKDAGIEIEVLLADDQVEPDRKRIIAVKPVAPLNPHTSYTLVISKTLTAKNGETLGNDVSITFTTDDLEIVEKENEAKTE